MIKAVFSWIATLWICWVFLASLPYKFARHPDTQHIFGTIGRWISDTIAVPLGSLFTSIGAYVIGSAELLSCLVLLAPAAIILFRKLNNGYYDGIRARWHAMGGLMAAILMSGAVFFHLFTPLGIEVLHEGKSDGGSLFYAAVSILVLGITLFVINITGKTAAHE